MLSTVLFCLERCRVQLKGAKQRQKTHKKYSIFCCFLPFVTVALWARLLSFLYKAPVMPLLGNPPRAAVCWTSKPKELLGRADTPFYLFRNKTMVCTEVDDYLSTSFLPVLLSLPEKRTRAWFLFPVFLPICRFCLAGTTVRWEGIWKDCFYTWQVCSVSGWERKGVCHCWKSLLHLQCQENPSKSFFFVWDAAHGQTNSFKPNCTIFFSLFIVLLQHRIICRTSENNSGSLKIHQGQQFVLASPRGQCV